PLASSPGFHANGTFAYGINDSGQIVGWYDAASDFAAHGFLYSGGVFTTIDDPAGNNTMVFGINNAGQCVGQSSARGFVFTPDGFGFHTVTGWDFSWQLVAAGDYNHDGTTDVIWEQANGVQGGWLMNNNQIAGTLQLPTFPDWNVVANGDFNKDGNTDIMWQNDDGLVA